MSPHFQRDHEIPVFFSLKFINSVRLSMISSFTWFAFLIVLIFEEFSSFSQDFSHLFVSKITSISVTVHLHLNLF